MKKSSRLVIGLATGLMFVSSRSVAAEDRVATAESAAEAAAETPEGKTYAQEVASAFGREQGKSIQACATEVKRPELSDFHVFARVGAAGLVEETLVDPNTNLAACLRDKLAGWKLAAPPRADQWVRIDVKLKSK